MIDKLQGVPKKSVNKEISITFEQMATQRCVRSQIGGIFGCWALLNNCQEYRMCPSCVYTCLNIYNPCTIFIISKVMQISLFTLFLGHPVHIFNLLFSSLLTSSELSLRNEDWEYIKSLHCLSSKFWLSWNKNSFPMLFSFLFH